MQQQSMQWFVSDVRSDALSSALGSETYGVVVLDDLPEHEASEHGGNADHDLLQEITDVGQDT